MDGRTLKQLILDALETEFAGVEIYKAALARNAEAESRTTWNGFVYAEDPEGDELPSGAARPQAAPGRTE